MISNKTAKLIKSLHQKKFRKQTGCFLVQGTKSVIELLDSDFNIQTLVFTKGFWEKLTDFLKNKINSLEYYQIPPEKLNGLSTLKNNETALAIVTCKPNIPIYVHEKEFGIILDNINDPGNLGTILRIADWFGISKIICSHQTADIYNPKVINASMGSFLRIQAFYTNLQEYLANNQIPVMGTFLQGKNIHHFNFPEEGLLVMGNESNGISPSLEKYISSKLYIPKFGHAESLNVGIATAIICDRIMEGNEK